MVGVLGIEPSLSAPKADVLPVYYTPNILIVIWWVGWDSRSLRLTAGALRTNLLSRKSLAPFSSQTIFKLGGSGGTRTHDQLLKRQLLYQLSYRPALPNFFKSLVPSEGFEPPTTGPKPVMISISPRGPNSNCLTLNFQVSKKPTQNITITTFNQA